MPNLKAQAITLGLISIPGMSGHSNATRFVPPPQTPCCALDAQPFGPDRDGSLSPINGFPEVPERPPRAKRARSQNHRGTLEGDAMNECEIRSPFPMPGLEMPHRLKDEARPTGHGVFIDRDFCWS
jgi:hypothetical protein